MLIDGLESCGLLVDYCDVFISSRSDGTHSLQNHLGGLRVSTFSFLGELFLYFY